MDRRASVRLLTTAALHARQRRHTYCLEQIHSARERLQSLNFLHQPYRRRQKKGPAQFNKVSKNSSHYAQHARWQNIPLRKMASTHQNA